MRRVVISELLDSDAGTPAEIAASLRDLRRINRWFGGVRTTRAMIEQVARHTGRHELTLLDVAAGSGDVAKAVQQQMQARGVRLKVTLFDRSLQHLRDAAGNARSLDSRQQQASARDDESYMRRSPDDSVRRIVGDALALPFADNSFDLVSCALFAHHLEPVELEHFCAEALRVCRVAVLINDLRRSAMSLALVYAGFPLFRSRLTRHDGPASVRRAYTIVELRTMLRHTRVQRVEVTRHYLFRMGAIVWKQATMLAS